MTRPRNEVPARFTAGDSVLVVVDIQERFRSLIHGMDRVVAGTERLIRFCRELNIPIVVTEHYPQKLGVTLTEVRHHFQPFEPIAKIHFSCCGCDDFDRRLNELNRSQIILCGIETHVCIYQTALDLLRRGRQVAVVEDAVSSCSAADRAIGLREMDKAGVHLPGVQMLMFEILHRAGTPQFKKVAALLKG